MKVNTTVLAGLAIAVLASTATATLNTHLVAEGATWDDGTTLFAPGYPNGRIGTSADYVHDWKATVGNDAGTVGHTARFNAGGSNFNGSDYFDVGGSPWWIGGTASGIAAQNEWDFTTTIVANIAPSPNPRTVMTVGALSTTDVGGASSGNYAHLTLMADGNLMVGWRGNNEFAFEYFTTTSGMDFRNADHIFSTVYRASDDIEVFVDGASVLTFGLDTSGVIIDAIDHYTIGGAIGSRSSVIFQSDNNAFDFTEVQIDSDALSNGDVLALQQGLGTTYGITVIPEPATLGLVALMGGAMLFIRRFRI